MTKGGIVENNVVIDVKNRGSLHMSKINIGRWILLKVSLLDFLMTSLDTLSLKEFLPYIPRSNGILYGWKYHYKTFPMVY